jgi:hypothetical protein
MPFDDESVMRFAALIERRHGGAQSAEEISSSAFRQDVRVEHLL